MEENDETLVAASLAGSTGAFETLVRRYQPRVLRFLENQLGNHEDARDCTQRVFLHAYESLARFKPGLRFAPWLFAIARFQGIDQLRHTGARRDLTKRFTNHEDVSSSSPDPASLLDAREGIEQRWHWVRDHLDDRSFQILWLLIQEEMDTRDIARVMKLTRSHVKVLLFRARKTLRRQFDAETARAEHRTSIPIPTPDPDSRSPFTIPQP